MKAKELLLSVVAFLENGEIKVGDPAKRQGIINPKYTISSIKRFMGNKHSEVNKELSYVTFEVVKGQNDTTRVKIRDKNYTPQEISAMILQKMKKTAEDYLGQTVTEAIITVPAYFNRLPTPGNQRSRRNCRSESQKDY